MINTKKWKAPSMKYRKTYKKKYGSRCFLLPKENKFPICTRGKVDCKFLSFAKIKTLRKKIVLDKNWTLLQ